MTSKTKVEFQINSGKVIDSLTLVMNEKQHGPMLSLLQRNGMAVVPSQHSTITTWDQVQAFGKIR
jgi:hypothetical protein